MVAVADAGERPADSAKAKADTIALAEQAEAEAAEAEALAAAARARARAIKLRREAQAEAEAEADKDAEDTTTVVEAAALGRRLAESAAGPGARIVPVHPVDSALADLVRPGDVVDIVAASQTNSQSNPTVPGVIATDAIVVLVSAKQKAQAAANVRHEPSHQERSHRGHQPRLEANRTPRVRR